MRRSTCTLLLDPATGQPVPAAGHSATGKPCHQGSGVAGHSARLLRALHHLACCLLILPVALLVTGCGGGGYPGVGITGTGASTNTIDAGQSIPESVTVSGNLPVTWTLSGSTCGSACGSISSTSGASITYTAPSPVTTSFTVTLTAAIAGTNNTRTITINVNPAPAIVGTPPVGNVGSPYTFTFTTPGGTSPKTLKLLSGTLPAGLTFNAATGVVSGTPTAMGTSSFVLQLVDSSDVPYTVTATEQITIAGPLTGSGGAGSLAVSGAPPAGTVGTAYSTTLQATGGTSPYTWAITAGALPAGLTLNATTGVISGTPTAAGTSTFTARATDAVGNTASSMFSIVVSASKPAIGSGTLPTGTVGSPYTGTIPVTGGTGPYQCTVTGGTLPAGLTIGANCTITGTPTAPGTTTVTVGVTDSSNPPGTGSGTVTVTINPKPVSLTTGTLPNGTVGTPYSSTIGVTGGTAPYTCTLAGGTLPTGLTLNTNCSVTGTPTTAGTSSIMVKATDSANPAGTTTGTVGITIAPAAALAVGNPPAATAGAPYTGTVPVSGGTGPYQCTVTGGTLPAGLTLGANCTITGTPTTPGTTTVTISTTDSGNPPDTGSGTVTITVNPPPASLTLGTPPAATVGTPYTGTIPVTGGTSPYSCTITAGTLPAGLTLGANCTVTGTPTTAGSSTVSVSTTDAGNPARTGSGMVTVTVNPTAGSLTLGTPPAGVVGTPYTGTIPVTGGTAPYNCTVTAGSLPAGLTLGANCALTGTPTTAGSSTVTVSTTDSTSPSRTGTGTVTITIDPAANTLALGTPPAATVGTPYTGTIPVSGGTAPYSCTITAGALPAGLTLGANCLVTGTPTAAGSSTVTVATTDGSSPTRTGSGTVTVTVNPAPTTTLTVGTPPAATVGTPYSGTIPVSGGTAPYSCTVTAGTLPSGLSLGANCTLTGTPTAPGTTTVTVSTTDSGSPTGTGSGTVTITVNPAPSSLTLGTPPAATVGTPYTGTIPVTGGTAPYNCTITAGTLPAGLNLGANCAVTGTPTVAGSSTVTVAATDSANPAVTGSGAVVVTVNPVAGSLTLGTPPAATVGTPYTGTIPVAGGTAPYSCTITAGTLPAGLSLGANCAVTGTPTTAGSATVTVVATDSGNPATTGSSMVTVTVDPAPASLTLGTPPAATVGTPYSGTIPVSGGTAPYSCTVTAGTLPSGLSLGANCTITGTPTTPGTTTVTVSTTDSGSPAGTGSGTVTITVNPAPVTLAMGNLPNGTVGTPYTGTVSVSGGTSPYTCTQTGGTLPAGLTLNSNCTVTGTPTVAGTTTATVTAMDSANPAQTTAGNETVTISPAALVLSTGTLPNGTVSTPYSANIGVSGGTSPYTCAVAGGTLPAGLSLNANCSVIGTPTVAGTTTVMVRATDSGNPAQTYTASEPITINPAPALTIGSPVAGTVGTPYTGTIPVTGGTAPYTCALAGGTLPAGLSFNANCTVTGTPTTAGSSVISVMATDSSSPATTTTSNVTVTVNPAPVTLTLGNPPTATVSTPYTGTIPVVGGTAPYTCTLAGGTLPAGLTFNANCTVTGTPTTAGTSTLQVTATDSATPTHSVTGPVVVTVQPVPTLTFTGSLPNGVVNQAYSQTLQATGGVGPYTYAVTSGTLPAGLTLSSGIISGTPTTPGASSFTVTATDSEGTPMTAALPLVLLVTYATTPNDKLLQGPYAFLFQGYDDVVLGVLAYQTATAGSITADGNGAITGGEQDSNGQGSLPAGTTVDTRNLLGTYTIGSDNRGFLTLTSFNTDGTVNLTHTYAIALKAPATAGAPATRGSFIEFDDANLVGTRGNGTLLAQSPSAITAGLNGSYAFGLQGDTPCLPTCTIGVVAGPVASVGQFNAANFLVTAGSVDANIGAVKFSNEALTGSYTAADTNGRVQLNLTAAGLPAGVFPADYAAYVVDGSNLLIVSTDKHSAYILQAGTGGLQTLSSFSNTSLTGPFVGYENSPVNPGLLSVALQQVLNYQTATIFRATGDGAGNCYTGSVTSSGVTGIINSLGSLIPNVQLASALLGDYQTIGNSSCTVSTTGRGEFDYPTPTSPLPSLLDLLGLSSMPPAPRIVYLTAPGTGYFLETSYAGLGRIEAQSGAPYTNASLIGTFVYASSPASSLATINSNGIFTADGLGNDVSLVDRNVGVGNVNVLSLAVAVNGTYGISDTTAGRFSLSTGETVYEIAPGRFVLLEPVINTAPYVALLY